MGNVFVFIPRHAVDARRNLANFVESCRTELTIFEPDFRWEDSTWSTPGVGFYNIDQGKGSRRSNLILRDPFLDFSKAYVRYRQTHNPNVHYADMRALKCVERALTNMTGAADPCDIDEAVLDMAAQVAREYYKQAYSAGREISALGRFLSDHKLTAKSIDWKNPIRRPSDTIRTGLEAKKKREAKLPSREVLDAIADIFAENPSDHSDIFVTSAIALLLCAPSRIGEIIILPADCEVEERKRNGSIAYGWRFRPKKGGAPMIKWIPDVMVEIAKEAIARVRQITQPARDLALWLEHGGALPVSMALHFENALELGNDIAKALVGGDFLTDLPHALEGRARRFAKDDLLSALRNEIRSEHRHFPYIDENENLKWSELLFCFNKYQLAGARATVPLRLWKPDNNTLNFRLDADRLSIFKRRDIAARNGAPLSVTSHQFRHLLGTIANRGGLSGSEIARWRGSKDVKQNRAYDHRSEFELAAMIRANDPALIRGSSEIEIAEKIKIALPLTTEEFNALEKTTAHITEIGFCLHDFVMSPCQRFRDCLNCTEQVCVKGDRRLSGLRDQLALVEQQLDAARKGAAEGLYGADPWTHIQLQTRDRLLGLIEIMEDPTIPEGSVIRLANAHEFSSARRALRQQGILSSPNASIEHHPPQSELH